MFAGVDYRVSGGGDVRCCQVGSVTLYRGFAGGGGGGCGGGGGGCGGVEYLGVFGLEWEGHCEWGYGDVGEYCHCRGADRQSQRNET